GISLISFYQRGFETIPSKIKTMEECTVEKAIVVFSGGQDSTTCLLWAIKEFEEVEAVTFLYGQRHELEVECSKKIAKELGVKQKIIQMELLNQLTENALTRKNMEIEEEKGDIPNTYVEDRKSTRLNSSHVSIAYAVFCW